ncbi:hypothetical protein KFU94_29155 [Chloroflexi bacterium TSY]|nr:hypothetical protein [Chloroflexi bacterium TSY]
MKILRMTLFFVLAVCSGLWWTTQPTFAAANPSRSNETGIDCHDGVCIVEVDFALLVPRFEFDVPFIQEFGVRSGNELAYLAVPVDEEQRYFLLLLGNKDALELAHVDPNDDPTALPNPLHYRMAFVMAPQDTFAYLEGGLSLTYDERTSFINQLFNPANSLLLLPDTLPVREQIHASVAGLVTDNISDLFIEVRGGYRLSGGLLADRAGFDAIPISIEGLLAVGGHGLELTTNIQSAIQPGRIFDSELAADLFVPFTNGWSDMQLSLRSYVELPIAGIDFDGYTTIDRSSLATSYDSTIATVNQSYDWLLNQTKSGYTALADGTSDLIWGSSQ